MVKNDKKTRNKGEKDVNDVSLHNSSKIDKKKKRKLKKWVLIVILIILLIGDMISGIGLINRHEDNKKIDTINKEIEEDIKVEQVEEEGELVNPPEETTENKTSDYWNYIKVPFYDVDFNNLISKNNDTVAFIHMDNTNINYPVVQTDNNDYYLNHAFDKTKNSAGWVYMDYRNSATDLSDNTIIYGHGRINQTVFGSLNKVLTKSWQNNKDNYIIWLSTTKENLVWQIFSDYTIQAESYYIKANFTSDSEKEAWINEMKKRNIAPQSADVSIYDKFLTLSTCKNNIGERIVVQAKLIKRQAK